MVSTPHYLLNSNTRANWTTTQEKSLANDFPFDLEKESDDQFVVRTYLQFLWLPESIMPLKLLVPSLLRVPSDPSAPHALHTYLKPLLQTARSASKKYNLELPKILSNGGGAGEIEETMMWYALSYEKADEDLWTRAAAIGEGPWVDEKWRSKWLERMERREYKIQILLYFLELSLPGPPLPPPSPQKGKGKGKGKRSQEETNTGRPPEECLEIFMDKLSMWQLMEGLENVTKPPETSFNEKPLDWIQTFFEEVVKPQFETQLPELCSLMRSKIFPHSLFSSSSPGSSTPSSSRATSPNISSRQPSPAPSNTSSKARPLVRDRERSRSLSVSLAQERERERERSVTTLLPKKRALNREVSMSRAFKPKPKAGVSQEKEENVRKAKVGLQNEGTRAKNEPTTKDEGVLLVEATPTRPKLARSQSTFSVNVNENETAQGTPSRSHSRTQSFSFQASLGTKDDTDDDIDDEGHEDEDEWRLPGSSSPDVLLLKRGRHVGDAQATGVLVDCTPTKRSRLR